MKKNLLSIALAFNLITSSAFILSACNKPDPEDTIIYTVTESQWETNFNITKSKTQLPPVEPVSYNERQLLADSTNFEEINSYTVTAEGVWRDEFLNQEEEGKGILKVAPNGMDMEFYLDGILQPAQTGKASSSDPWYIGLTTMLRSFFPFSGQYNNFTFDETKKAYVAENLKSTVVSEDDITQTYDLYDKKVEITFINGYLNTITIDMCQDEEYDFVYLSLVFTFTNINNTVVTLE